jgi:UDP-GlcNAc:undecaprenyl-phosphate/decaprenyl-phosphate GlcNAc-1-phosphate transferase
MPDVASYLVVGGAAAGTTVMVTPLVRALSLHQGWVVAPDERRVHDRVTPDVGGMAMLAGFIVAMGVAWRMDRFHDMFTTTEPLGVLLAAVVMYAVGFIDDLRDVSAPGKVAGMVVASSCLFLLGVQILNLKLPLLDILYIPDDLSPLLTTLWVVGMANAVNLMDGLDGLAAGIMAIASATFFVYTQQVTLDNSSSGPLVAVIVCGICVGFLPWNMHPARIFMGDGGALMLGVLMAASTIVVGGQNAQGEPVARGQAYFFFAPLFIPLVILGVPILDMAFAIVRRASRRAGLATADKDHLHHRLLRLGHGHLRSVLILWGWTAALSLLVLYPVVNDRATGYLPFLVVAAGLALYTLFHPSLRRSDADDDRRRATNADENDAPGPRRRSSDRPTAEANGAVVSGSEEAVLPVEAPDA